MRVKGEDVVLEGLERRNVRWVLGNEVEPDYLRSRGTGLVEGRREEMVNDSGKRGIPIDFVRSNEDRRLFAVKVKVVMRFRNLLLPFS